MLNYDHFEIALMVHFDPLADSGSETYIKRKG